MAEEFDEIGGLTKGERKVYLALAGLGPSTANPVIKQTGMQKSAVYFCLERLVSKGLASYITRNNRRVFEAAPSAKLGEFIEQRKRRLDAEKAEMDRAVKSLIANRGEGGRKGARFFEGWSGLEIALEDSYCDLDQKDELRVFSVTVASNQLERFRRLIKKFHDRRAEKKVRARMVMNERMRETLGRDRENTPYTEVHYVPPEYSTPATINVYKDKVLIILLSGESPTTFLVEGKEIADSFRQYFELLWSEETRVYRGLKGMEALLEDVLQYKDVVFIGGRGDISLRMPDYFWKSFAPRAEKKGHKWKILGIPEIVETPVMNAKFIEVRTMSHAALGPIVIWIFGNKVANVIWKKDPIAFVLENKEVAQRYRDYFTTLWEDETRIYRGIGGLRALWDKSLQYDQVRNIGGRGQAAVNDPDYFFKSFAPRAEKKGFRWRILGLPEIMKTPIVKAKFVEIRLLPELAIGPTVIQISGDRVINIVWKNEREPIAFEIENKELAKSYGEYFEMLWKTAKKVK
ncbi:Sugar-specific transcriptional regulator TrmB [Candidatus Gugararchaeum adminiculabundum]|nr:Sugar-specific transcriptional regulator TrmB [Candidatus Gugararchaeum adminiculabundum]